MRTPPSSSHLILITSWRPHSPPNTTILGVRALTYEFWEDIVIQPIIIPILSVLLKAGVLLVKEIFFMVCWISFFVLDREMFISGDLVKADVFKAKLMFDVCHSQGGVWLGSMHSRRHIPVWGTEWIWDLYWLFPEFSQPKFYVRDDLSFLGTSIIHSFIRSPFLSRNFYHSFIHSLSSIQWLL